MGKFESVGRRMKYCCEKLDFGELCGVILLVNALFMFFITEFFTVNNLSFWKEGRGILVLWVVCSIIAGGIWVLHDALLDIRSDLVEIRGEIVEIRSGIVGIRGSLSALIERMDSFEKRLGNLEVIVQSINEYLRQGDIHFIPKPSSTSDIRPVPKDAAPPYKPPPDIMP